MRYLVTWLRWAVRAARQTGKPMLPRAGDDQAGD